MDNVHTQARPVVLVVEDDSVQRLLVVDVVEDAGFDAIIAMGADDAVAILGDRSDVRVVLTDIDMPNGVDGMRMANFIRNRWPPIGLIIVSGKRSLQPDELPARGVFFSKPYRPEQVAETLQQMVG